MDVRTDDMAKPSGVVTFLFTDIEGSTRRWEADAEAMRVALEAHDEVLREAVEAHDGTVFKHTGDGMCAVFASPRAAVDAAIAAQRALELPVRMGIATGEAELRGGDYFGMVLNRAARVMSSGHGGTDPARWRHCWSARRGRPRRSWVPTVARHREAGRDLPGPGRRACAPSFRR